MNPLEEAILDAQRFIERAPHIIGTEAVRVVDDHFRTQSLIGEGAWVPRVPGTPRQNRKLLSDTNTLQDSMGYRVQGSSVMVGIDLARVPYAQIQNEGGVIPVTLKMKKYFWAQYLETGNEFWKRLALKQGPIVVPARPFLSITPYMLRRIEEALTNSR